MPTPTTLRPMTEDQNLLNHNHNHDYKSIIYSPLAFCGGLLVLAIGLGLVVIFYNICTPESPLCFFGSCFILCIVAGGAIFLFHISGKYIFFLRGFNKSFLWKILNGKEYLFEHSLAIFIIQMQSS